MARIQPTSAQIEFAKDFNVRQSIILLGSLINKGLAAKIKADSDDSKFVKDKLIEITKSGNLVSRLPTSANVTKMTDEVVSLVSELMRHQGITDSSKDGISEHVAKFTAFNDRINTTAEQSQPEGITVTTTAKATEAKPVHRKPAAKAAVKPAPLTKVVKDAPAVAQAATTTPVEISEVVKDTATETVIKKTSVNVNDEVVHTTEKTTHSPAMVIEAGLLKHATKFFERLEKALQGTAIRVKVKELKVNSEKDAFIPDPVLLENMVKLNPIGLGNAMYRIHFAVKNDKLADSMRKVLEIVAGDIDHVVFEKDSVKLAKKMLKDDNIIKEEVTFKKKGDKSEVKVTILKPLYSMIDDILGAGKMLAKASVKGVTTLPKPTNRQQVRRINNNYRNATGGLWAALTVW